MGMGEAGSVGALFQSGYWDLGLRRRERRRMIGKERQEQPRPKQPHRQVVLVLCVSIVIAVWYFVGKELINQTGCLVCDFKK